MQFEKHHDILLDVFLNGTFHDESSGVRHVRRLFHPGRGLGGPRARRSNMHFTSSTTGGLSTSQSSSQSSNYSREAMDPIAGQSHDTHTRTQTHRRVGGTVVACKPTLCFCMMRQGRHPLGYRTRSWHSCAC